MSNVSLRPTALGIVAIADAIEAQAGRWASDGGASTDGLVRMGLRARELQAAVTAVRSRVGSTVGGTVGGTAPKQGLRRDARGATITGATITASTSTVAAPHLQAAGEGAPALRAASAADASAGIDAGARALAPLGRAICTMLAPDLLCCCVCTGAAQAACTATASSHGSCAGHGALCALWDAFGACVAMALDCDLRHTLLPTSVVVESCDRCPQCWECAAPPGGVPTCFPRAWLVSSAFAPFVAVYRAYLRVLPPQQGASTAQLCDGVATACRTMASSGFRRLGDLLRAPVLLELRGGGKAGATSGAIEEALHGQQALVAQRLCSARVGFTGCLVQLASVGRASLSLTNLVWRALLPAVISVAKLAMRSRLFDGTAARTWLWGEPGGTYGEVQCAMVTHVNAALKECVRELRCTLGSLVGLQQAAGEYTSGARLLRGLTAATACCEFGCRPEQPQPLPASVPADSAEDGEDGTGTHSGAGDVSRAVKTLRFFGMYLGALVRACPHWIGNDVLGHIVACTVEVAAFAHVPCGPCRVGQPQGALCGAVRTAQADIQHHVYPMMVGQVVRLLRAHNRAATDGAWPVGVDPSTPGWHAVVAALTGVVGVSSPSSGCGPTSGVVPGHPVHTAHLPAQQSCTPHDTPSRKAHVCHTARLQVILDVLQRSADFPPDVVAGAPYAPQLPALMILPCNRACCCVYTGAVVHFSAAQVMAARCYTAAGARLAVLCVVARVRSVHSRASRERGH